MTEKRHKLKLLGLTQFPSGEVRLIFKGRTRGFGHYLPLTPGRADAVARLIAGASSVKVWHEEVQNEWTGKVRHFNQVFFYFDDPEEVCMGCGEPYHTPSACPLTSNSY